MATVRELNDVLHTTFKGGRVLATIGVRGLPEAVRRDVLRAVQEFVGFTPEDDPHGEHDFGALAVQGHAIFWKIDYYDERMEFGSEDSADLRRTTRVLTVMLAEEY